MAVEDGVLLQFGVENPYVKAKPSDSPIWTELPEQFRPKEWSQMRIPVVPLDQNLYGLTNAVVD